MAVESVCATVLRLWRDQRMQGLAAMGKGLGVFPNLPGFAKDLLRDFGDSLHSRDQIASRQHLIVRRVRDAIDQSGGVFGHSANTFQGRASLSNAVRFLLHFGLLFSQRTDALVSVRLNRLDERADLPRCRRRTLGQLSDFFGDDGKPSAVLAGSDGLDRRVQREHVGAV